MPAREPLLAWQARAAPRLFQLLQWPSFTERSPSHPLYLSSPCFYFWPAAPAPAVSCPCHLQAGPSVPRRRPPYPLFIRPAQALSPLNTWCTKLAKFCCSRAPCPVTPGSQSSRLPASLPASLVPRSRGTQHPTLSFQWHFVCLPPATHPEPQPTSPRVLVLSPHQSSAACLCTCLCKPTT